MAKHGNSHSKRQHILNTANRVVDENGVSALTLEAVAEASGISKGGLLYHFPNKDALISAMLDAYLEDFEDRLSASITTDDGPINGRWLRAFVHASFEDVSPDASLTSSGIAAIVNNPQLLHRVQDHYDAWQRRALDDGIDADTALMVMAATDGIWYAQLFGFGLTPDVRARIQHKLLALLR